ncbi:alpha/beta hydrolase [Asticcacaulis sp. AND118]|uniref:alpha/beta hydrolase n=1 Tax=Asticcacaulis sp. AND118 TaxID=2840468 RepID=UPI001CFF701A|nr:alpha/beta hydrolase [Asticcacaulis sp. AND118]UDF02921.1 alpha/beta hydrolase [Asticcacaulis sp. AND118]
MDLDRRALMTAGLGAGLASATVSASGALAQTAELKNLEGAVLPAETTEYIDLWPNGPAGLLKADLAEVVKTSPTPPPRRLVNGVVRPRLAVYRPEKPNGAAMLVIPGGGYTYISVDHEGHNVGRVLSAAGITVFVLYYRLPAEGWADASDVPLMDAQRAMRLIKVKAKDYRVDPARVGVMGFSAGGHLCASLATGYGAPVYPAVDIIDTQDARPAISAPIYAVISMKPGLTHAGSRGNLIGANANADLTARYSTENHVTAQTPPTFLLHAEDDGAVPVDNTLAFRAALKTAGVPVETHLFPKGGHGFGILNPVVPWSGLFLHFARQQGLYA